MANITDCREENQNNDSGNVHSDIVRQEAEGMEFFIFFSLFSFPYSLHSFP